MSHTPGPWHIGTSADGTPAVCVPVHVSEGTDFVVAQVNKPRLMGCVTGCAEANARLIAAAPDLLAALEEALLDHMAPHDCEPECWSHKAAVAIKKARGE